MTRTAGSSPVVVDFSAVQSPATRGRGIGRYALAWACAIERADAGVVAAYVLNPALAPPGALGALEQSPKVRYRDARTIAAADVFHQLAPFDLDQPASSLFPRLGAHQRRSATLYDLIPAKSLRTELVDATDRRRYRTRLELVRAQDHLLALSEATADDAARCIGGSPRVTVVGAAPDARFAPPHDRAAATAAAIAACATSGLRGPYVLYPSGSHPRKDTERVVRAFAAAPDLVARAQLVVAGDLAPPFAHHLRMIAADSGADGSVVVPGALGDEAFATLYQGAALVCFASLAEGFGLPIVEAAACGTPVIASDIAPHAELLAPEARFAPGDEQAIAAAIATALEHPPAIPVPPAWDDVARRSLAAFDRVLTSPRPTRRPRRRARPRVALVSPFPPAPTGVARYSEGLVAAMAGTEKVSLTCFVDGPTPGQRLPAEIEHYRVEALQHVEAMRGDFDAVVYVLGNSHHHLGALRMLARRPGHVLAHDVRLTNLYRHLHGDPGFLLGGLGHEIARMYDGQLPASLGTSGDVTDAETERYGLLMARDVIARAQSFLVTSTAAARLARRDARHGAGRIDVVPFALAPPATSDFAERADPCAAITERDPWGSGPSRQSRYLCHFGIVDRIKAPELLVDALAALGRDDVSLVFVGPVADDVATELAARAAARGVREQIGFTGPLGAGDYAAWLAAATCALQLRRATNGEASAAVGECLASAVPTIVSATGWAAELPDEAVVRIDPGAGPDELARAVAALLDDDRRRRELGDAGARHARLNGFDFAARALLARLAGGVAPLVS